MIILNEKIYKENTLLSEKQEKEIEFYLGENLWRKLNTLGYVVLLFPTRKVTIHKMLSNQNIWLTSEER